MISIVIPVYNEIEVLPDLEKSLCSIMDKIDDKVEVILVDDGSSDGSDKYIHNLSKRDDRFKYIIFSRNFGQQMALTAGMDYASGDAVIFMDADLQDPPEIIIDLIKRWREGNEVAYAVRRERQGESFFKKMTARIFYRIMGLLSKDTIPLDTGEFRLIDRKIVDILKKMPERHRLLRGLVPWIGFRQVPVYYHREPRAKGKSKFSIPKMLQLALDGITAFSILPLRIPLYIGIFLIAFSFLLFILSLFGLSWLYLWLSLGFGFLFLFLGIIGEYVGRILEEEKGRPLYIVDKIGGFHMEKTENA